MKCSHVTVSEIYRGICKKATTSVRVLLSYFSCRCRPLLTAVSTPPIPLPRTSRRSATANAVNCGFACMNITARMRRLLTRSCALSAIAWQRSWCFRPVMRASVRGCWQTGSKTKRATASVPSAHSLSEVPVLWLITNHTLYNLSDNLASCGFSFAHQVLAYIERKHNKL